LPIPAEQSSFPDSIDSFTSLSDLPPSLVTSAARYQTLKTKETLTSEEALELSTLTTTLQNYLITPSRWNKFSNCLVNMETFILSEVNGFIETKQTEMTSYITTKETEFQAEIDKFTSRGVYVHGTQYYKKNYVIYNDGTGDNIYICILNAINIYPTNTTYWQKLGIKGETGESGVGLIFKGAWNIATTYNQDEAVQHSGVIFGALQANSGQQPDISQDTVYWAKAWDIAVTVSELKGTRSITASTTSVNFIVGEITAFNSNTDTLDVYKNTTRLTENTHYTINANNIQINNIGGTWDGTIEEPIFFEFVVRRNMINSLVFSDGQSISDGTVSKSKLSVDVQGTLDTVAVNSNGIGTLSQLTTTNKSNLVSAVNENVGNISNLNSTVDTHLADIAQYKINLKRRMIMGVRY